MSTHTPVIKTSHIFPPIPIRNFDWAAYDDSTYDGASDGGGQIVGHGATEQAAIDDFMEQWAEEHPEQTDISALECAMSDAMGEREYAFVDGEGSVLRTVKVAPGECSLANSILEAMGSDRRWMEVGEFDREES